MERFISLSCVLAAFACFTASTANAVYMTFAGAAQSLVPYGMAGNGVIVARKAFTGPDGKQYTAYYAVDTNQYQVSIIQGDGYGNPYSITILASSSSVYSSPLYTTSGSMRFVANYGGRSRAVVKTTPYVTLQSNNGIDISYSSFKLGPIISYHFPDYPESSTLIDVTPSLAYNATLTCVSPAASGGKTYLQLLTESGWQTVQVTDAPATNTSHTYTAQDVALWTGSLEGVSGIRAVSYTSAGAYVGSSTGTITGSTQVWDTGDYTIPSTADGYTSTVSTQFNLGSSSWDDQYLISNTSGGLSYGDAGTGAVSTGATTVSVAGTAADTLEAANVQTGIQRQTLAATADGNSILQDIASDVDTIAENSDSSGESAAGGGLSDSDSALLENIDKNVQDAADRQAAFDEMTGYDREDSMADILDDARDALVSAVSGAQDAAASALASQGLAGSDQSAGNTSPSGASNFWQINLPWGAQLKFDPADVSEIATILYAVRAALGWIFLGWFYQWFVPRLREAYQTIILTPTPVANTNPAGLVGSVTNATKVVIWVAVLVSIPSIVSGILDTSSAISGFTGMVSWRDTNPIQEVSAASTPLGAAVKLVGCVFPVATVLNLFVLYVTAELFMTTFVYLMIFANKHITSY